MISVARPVFRAVKTGPLASFLFVLLCGLLAACQPRQELLAISGATMGTTYHVKVVAAKVRDPAALKAGIDALLAQINQSMSTYIEDSELNQFSRSPIGQPFSASPELFTVLSLAKDIYRFSNGAFDPTVGPLVDVWGFGPQQREEQVPTADEIAALMADIGYDKIAFDNSSHSVTRLHSLAVDLSAIAKGYGVDRVSEHLSGLGLTNHMVEIGGEVRLSGSNAQGQPWHIAIEAPVTEMGGVQRIIALSDVGLATSGDYRNYFEKDGKRYSHTIDPRTGRPIEHNLASVTVIRSTSAQADGLATAFMVMGADQALALANATDIPVFLVVKTGEGFAERYSAAFASYIQDQN